MERSMAVRWCATHSQIAIFNLLQMVVVTWLLYRKFSPVIRSWIKTQYTMDRSIASIYLISTEPQIGLVNGLLEMNVVSFSLYCPCCNWIGWRRIAKYTRAWSITWPVIVPAHAEVGVGVRLPQKNLGSMIENICTFRQPFFFGWNVSI